MILAARRTWGFGWLGDNGAPVVKGAIKVLARNEPPVIPCTVCQKPATQLCQECDCDGGAGLCDRCASKHECGEEMLVPLVNSPRAGVCAVQRTVSRTLTAAFRNVDTTFAQRSRLRSAAGLLASAL